MSSFILMNGNRSPVFLIVLSLVWLVSSWSYVYAKVTEVIAGFWLVATHCATSRDRLHVGMLRAPILKTARELRRGCDRRTSLYVKKSIRHRCSKRLLERLQLCKLC